MAEQEGVIKYTLEFEQGEPPSAAAIKELDLWRRICFQRDLIGQDSRRYDGYGFGNISCRIGPSSDQQRPFLITASQTGHLRTLTPAHYATVTACNPSENYVRAFGIHKPSSESLTHGMVYLLDATVRWVIHVHSPELWRHAPALHLPQTDETVPYGTPAMAAEVVRLFAATDVAQRGIFSMGGHEDGIVAFGPTAAIAGRRLLSTLALAKGL